LSANEPPAETLRAAFDSAPPYTVGIEDEVMLLDPETLQLVPRAEESLDLLDGDPRFKAELPASQLELLTPACADVPSAAAALFAGRQDLATKVVGRLRLASAGVHPFSPGLGELSHLDRYEHTIREYGPVAARELVCALQVHVSVGDADRALAVHDAARSYLPLLAALAANAPFYEGRDTGLASVRPKLAELLPRHGVPPALGTWENYADALRWGKATGFVPDVRAWWWDLRLHPEFGTLEFRVPDGQSSVADAAAIAAVAQSLVAWLGDRHEAGEPLGIAPNWRIAENSWSACRYGVEGEMADLLTGELSPTRASLQMLLEVLQGVAARLGAERSLKHARDLTEMNGAVMQRRVWAKGGADAVARWLADRFLEPWPG
jgi:carboxylate-amine ligase